MSKKTVGLLLAATILGLSVPNGVTGTRELAFARSYSEFEPQNANQAKSKFRIKPGRCDPMAQEQVDLSGTYKGKIAWSETGVSRDAILTITGDSFTLNDAAGATLTNGSLSSLRTCGYTAVAMRIEDTKWTTGTDNTKPVTVSLHAARWGTKSVLTSIGTEKLKFWFQCDCNNCKDKKKCEC